MASFTLKTTLTFTPDTGRSAQIVNNNAETEFTPAVGYTMGEEFTLAVGATNTAVTLAADTSVILVEETTDDPLGVLVKIGSTSASSLRVKRLVIEAPSLDVVAAASGVALYFTNESADSIRVRISKVASA